MLALLLAAVAVYFGVHALYVVAMAAKSAREAGRLTAYWQVVLWPFVVLGGVLDFVFNYTFGWMFLAKPRRYLFSHTVQHHYTHGTGWRGALAAFWARTLNVFDEHIK